MCQGAFFLAEAGTSALFNEKGGLAKSTYCHMTDKKTFDFLLLLSLSESSRKTRSLYDIFVKLCSHCKIHRYVAASLNYTELYRAYVTSSARVELTSKFNIFGSSAT